jgi:hypothetical protein
MAISILLYDQVMKKKRDSRGFHRSAPVPMPLRNVFDFRHDISIHVNSRMWSWTKDPITDEDYFRRHTTCRRAKKKRIQESGEAMIIMRKQGIIGVLVEPQYRS